jgi:SAM-dependent methyltransferase
MTDEEKSVNRFEDRQQAWDAKYERGLPSLETPDPFFLGCLEEFITPAFPNGGVALDLAGGLGRHALVLARAGWTVNLADISGEAISRVSNKARDEALRLDTFQGDASAFPFKAKQFDLIVLFYHFERELFPLIRSALKPGGILLTKLRVRWPTSDDDEDRLKGLPERNELPALLPGFQLLLHQERQLDKNGLCCKFRYRLTVTGGCQAA